MMGSLIRVALISLFLTATAHAARIEVFPGPGTPLQDAISSAAAGDELLVHSGTYNESIVIDRTLRVRPANVGKFSNVVIDAGCDTNTAVDIIADDVRLDGHSGTETAGLSVNGGTARTIRIAGGSGVQLKRMFVSGCPSATAVEISDSTKTKLKLIFAWPPLPLIGILVQNSTYVKLVRLGLRAQQTALRLENIAPGAPLGGAHVVVRRTTLAVNEGVTTPPERGVQFVAADGVALKGNYFWMAQGIAIDLDADSDNNRIVGSQLHTNGGGFVSDAGSGNQVLSTTCNGMACP